MQKETNTQSQHPKGGIWLVSRRQFRERIAEITPHAGTHYHPAQSLTSARAVVDQGKFGKYGCDKDPRILLNDTTITDFGIYV